MTSASRTTRSSRETDFAWRDDHLRSADFFDVDNHPTAHFRSIAVALDGTRGTITGDLIIKGITQPVALAAK